MSESRCRATRLSSRPLPGPGRHVRGVGEDVAAGELLFGPGHRLGPADLALAAAAGHAELPVIAAPDDCDSPDRRRVAAGGCGAADR